MNITTQQVLAPIINGVEIATDAEVRFTLNVLCKASGAEISRSFIFHGMAIRMNVCSRSGHSNNIFGGGRNESVFTAR